MPDNKADTQRVSLSDASLQLHEATSDLLALLHVEPRPHAETTTICEDVSLQEQELAQHIDVIEASTSAVLQAIECLKRLNELMTGAKAK